jgi:hypothetical protein
MNDAKRAVDVVVRELAEGHRNRGLAQRAVHEALAQASNLRRHTQHDVKRKLLLVLRACLVPDLACKRAFPLRRGCFGSRSIMCS